MKSQNKNNIWRDRRDPAQQFSASRIVSAGERIFEVIIFGISGLDNQENKRNK
jgi:hypothetical protein